MTRKPPTVPAALEPEFVAELKQIFEERIVFNRVLGIRVDHLGPDGVRAEIAMRRDLIGHYAYNRLHGGVISAGLDAMAGLAVMAAIGARHMDEPPAQRLQRFARLGTIDLRIDYLRPAKPRSGITAEAHCYKLTRSIAFVRAQAWDESADDPVATAQAAFMLTGAPA